MGLNVGELDDFGNIAVFNPKLQPAPVPKMEYGDDEPTITNMAKAQFLISRYRDRSFLNDVSVDNLLGKFLPESFIAQPHEQADSLDWADKVMVRAGTEHSDIRRYVLDAAAQMVGGIAGSTLGDTAATIAMAMPAGRAHTILKELGYIAGAGPILANIIAGAGAGVVASAAEEALKFPERFRRTGDPETHMLEAAAIGGAYGGVLGVPAGVYAKYAKGKMPKAAQQEAAFNKDVSDIADAWAAQHPGEPVDPHIILKDTSMAKTRLAEDIGFKEEILNDVSDAKQYQETMKSVAKKRKEAKMMLTAEETQALMEEKAGIPLDQEGLTAPSEEIVSQVYTDIKHIKKEENKRAFIDDIRTNNKQTVLTVDLNELFHIETKKGLSFFNKEKAIASEGELVEFTLEAHKACMDNMDSIDHFLGPSDYVVKTLLQVDKIKVANQDMLFSSLGRGLDLPFRAQRALQKEILDISLDTKKYAEVYQALTKGTELPPEYSSNLRILTTSLKRILKRVHNMYKESGRALNGMREYVPHTNDMEAILGVSEQVYADFVQPRADWERMFWDLKDADAKTIAENFPKEKYGKYKNKKPWLDPRIQRIIMGDIYNSIKATHGSVSYGLRDASSGSFEHRFIHFKDATAYAEYNATFGRSKSIYHAVVNHIVAASRIQALYQVFGPEPLKVLSALTAEMEQRHMPWDMTDAQKAAYWKNRRIINTYTKTFFEGSPVSNYTEHGVISWLSQANKWLITSALKNSFLYSLTEEMITRAFEMARATGSPAKGLTEFKQGYKDLLMDKEIKTMAVMHNLDKTILPDAVYIDSPSKGLKRVARVNEWLRTIVAHDYLSHRNKASAGRTWDGILHDSLKEHKWETLTQEIKNILLDSGITKEDFAYLKENLTKFEDVEHPYLDYPDADIASATWEYLPSRRLLETTKPKDRRIALKLNVAQQRFIDRSIITGKEHSYVPFTGPKPESKFWAFIHKNFGQFMGYQFEALMGMAEQVRQNKYHSNGNAYGGWTKTLSDNLFMMFVGALFFKMTKEFLRGRMINFHDPKQSREAIIDLAASSLPIPYWSQFFSDYTWNQGYGKGEKLLAQLGRMTIGMGPTKALQDAHDMGTFALAMARGDSREVMKRLRRLMPGANWVPTDLLVNRMLIDNLAYATLNEPYSFFQNERMKQRQRNYRYIPGLGPGELIGR